MGFLSGVPAQGKQLSIFFTASINEYKGLLISQVAQFQACFPPIADLQDTLLPNSQLPWKQWLQYIKKERGRLDLIITTNENITNSDIKYCQKPKTNVLSILPN